jgi:hypothetical protein
MVTRYEDAALGGRAPPRAIALSAMLRDLAQAPVETLSIGQMIDHFGARAFGAVLFVFSVPNLLPLPPGSSSVLGAPLVLIAPQVALGRRSPWVPGRVRRRAVPRTAFSAAFARLIGPLERIERVSRPRLTWLFGPVGERMIGLVCTVLALVLILPIPFGNMLPAAAVGALSLSLVQRDGVIALVGYALTATSALVLFLTGHVVLTTLRRLLEVIGL